MGLRMFPFLSSVRLPGDSSPAGRRPARFTLALHILLISFLALYSVLPSSAQSRNPIGALLGKSQAQASQGPPAPAAPPAEPQPLTAIPLPDVAMRAEELMRLLRDINGQLPAREQLDAVKATLDERDASLQAKQKEVEALLAGSPSPLEVREQETYWDAFSSEGAAMRRQLLVWANAAQSAVQQLQALQPQWTLTLEENQSTRDLGPTLDVIRDAVKSIQTTKAQAQDLLPVIVNLQVSASNQHQLALDTLNRLAQARMQLAGRILQRDSLPLWQILVRRQQPGESADFFRNTGARVLSIKLFTRENAGTLLVLGVVLLLWLFVAYRLYRATRGVQPADELQAQAVQILQHWFAVGLLAPLLLAFLLAPFTPLPLIGAAIVLLFFSILVLLPPLIEPGYRPLLHCLVAVYVFNATLAWITLSPATKREMLFLVFTAAVAVFSWLLRPLGVAEIENKGTSHRVLVVGMRVAVGVLALGQVANLFGYYGLSQYLTVLSIYGTFVALAIYTALRVFTLLLLAALSVPAAERLAVVRLHRAGIARWAPRVMHWTGILLWVGAVLGLMGVRAGVNEFIVTLFGFNLAGTSSNVTLGGVLSLFAILLVGYAISSAIRFLLREELLKRLHLQRGVPELISTTLHYLLLFLVFLFAVNAGGIALNKFTVLTGALGVGVGFGLQNIINNFVSGLILQFERPIRIGDVVEVQTGLTGTVTRIGIRSSTVQTFQGAEVIIPNATFISGNVTNWTLSEAKRRLELPVGVAYGTNPKLVKELLERPAIQHSDVLTSPAPAAFFKGFGQSSLDFELQFWVMQESNTVKVKSEVALEAMRLLAEAEIEIPFPQRDLRLRSVDAQAAAALSGDGMEREESSEDLRPRIRSAK
jgi:potassium-dependent mechanosensitive channel